MKKNSTKKMQEIDKQKVVNAVYELLHNPQTPGDLYEAVARAICDLSNKMPNFFHTEWGIEKLLNSVPPEHLLGAELARIKAEEARETEGAQ